MHLSGVITRITDAGIEVAFGDGSHMRFLQVWDGAAAVDRQPRTCELYVGAMVIVKMLKKSMNGGKTFPSCVIRANIDDI